MTGKVLLSPQSVFTASSLQEFSRNLAGMTREAVHLDFLFFQSLSLARSARILFRDEVLTLRRVDTLSEGGSPRCASCLKDYPSGFVCTRHVGPIRK